MKRADLVSALLKEGLSNSTLVNLSDKQLTSLHERFFGESTLMIPSANKVEVEKAMKAKQVFATYEEKQMSDKQRKFMDTDKDGDIDADDLSNLRKKKGEMKEGLSDENKLKLEDACNKLGCRKVARKLVDNHLMRTAGISSLDLSDTSILADGLDTIEELLEEKNWEEAYNMAKDTAMEMLSDEGFPEDLDESVCPKCGMKDCDCKDKKHGNDSLSEAKKEKKWIQKAVHPSKKGSLKKALGVKKDETIPAKKLKAAAKKKGKLGQRARFAMNVKGLKESQEMQEWLDKLAGNNYHPAVSKGEIINLINEKLNLKKSPELAETEKPTIAPPKPAQPKTPKKNPFKPKPGTKTKPKAKKKQSALKESEFGFGEFPKPKKKIWLQLMDRGIKDDKLSEKDYYNEDIKNVAKKLAAEFEKMEEPNRQSNKKLFLSMFYDAVSKIKSR